MGERHARDPPSPEMGGAALLRLVDHHEDPPHPGRPESLQQIVPRHLGSRAARGLPEADRQQLLAAGERSQPLGPAGGGDEAEKGGSFVDHQMIWTGYSRKSPSSLTTGTPSTIACAMTIRSKGSR